MRCRPIHLFMLILPVVAAAQTLSPDSAIGRAMLAEIRQLRSDLQSTAATIQRVQIAVYRLQSEATVLERATQRLEQARAACSQAQGQQTRFAAQIEQAEARRRNAQNTSEEGMISELKLSVEMFTAEEQQCQAERADAENQFRAEQARMNDLQDHLDKLDKVLAALGSK